MKQLLKKHETKLRFGLIGGINTALDIGLLLLLTNSFGIPKIGANVVSTFTTFIISFFANKKYTFKSLDNKNIVREMVLFTIVTLFGLWVIQGILLYILVPILQSFGLGENLSLLGAKLIATVASLVWNFVLYSKVVFMKKEKSTTSK